MPLITPKRQAPAMAAMPDAMTLDAATRILRLAVGVYLVARGGRIPKAQFVAMLSFCREEGPYDNLWTQRLLWYWEAQHLACASDMVQQAVERYSAETEEEEGNADQG